MMTGVCDVSVVIPAFDRVAVLPRALDSVLAQSRPAAEVIVVDDGSTDGTAALLDRDYPGVTVIRQPNRGVSAARNAGLAAATGEWLAFLDSDDEWRPRKLEHQLEALHVDATGPGPAGASHAPPKRRPHTDGGPPLVCHTDEIWIRNGRRVNQMKKHAKTGGWIFEHNLPMCRMSPSAALIHRSVLESVGNFDENLPACEDYDLWLRITSRFPVCFVEEPLVVKYGGHEDQLSRRFWGMDRFRIHALEKILLGGTLDEAQRLAATEALVEKIDVYVAGARKRGKKDEVEMYERKREAWGF
jgi:glycosyltransferase involved in cell wall biosynthesis